MKLVFRLDFTVAPSLTSMLQQVADRALHAEGVTQVCAAGLRLCDDEAIRELNRTCRGLDQSTDVLSFPTVRYPAGKTAGTCPERLRKEYDDDLDACYLGDIVISVPHAMAQAEEYQHAPMREMAYLLTHGLCHLMGYDHMEEGEKRLMRAKEEEILGSLGITRESIPAGEGTAPGVMNQAAVSDQVLLELAKEAMTRSYSPYSHYPVGAALLAEDGRIFQGCNIENASFGATNCAERTALFKAVSEGALSFTCIAIASVNSAPWPCGICRQALHEFAPELRVLVTWGDGQVAESSLPELLPYGFGPRDVK